MAIGTLIAAGGSLIGAGLSYRQAANQSRIENKAMKASEKLIADARKKAEKDYYEGLNVPLDAYGEQFAQNMANQQQTIQALQEGDTRNLIGGVQGLTAAAAAANEQTRIGLGQELYANRKIKADSKENKKQQLIDIDAGQAADQSQIARDAAQAGTSATQSAISGLVSAGLTIGEGMDLYGKTSAIKDAEKLLEGVTEADLLEMGLTRSQFLIQAKKRFSNSSMSDEDKQKLYNGGVFSVKEFLKGPRDTFTNPTGIDRMGYGIGRNPVYNPASIDRMGFGVNQSGVAAPKIK